MTRYDEQPSKTSFECVATLFSNPEPAVATGYMKSLAVKYVYKQISELFTSRVSSVISVEKRKSDKEDVVF